MKNNVILTTIQNSNNNRQTFVFFRKGEKQFGVMSKNVSADMLGKFALVEVVENQASPNQWRGELKRLVSPVRQWHRIADLFFNLESFEATANLGNCNIKVSHKLGQTAATMALMKNGETVQEQEVVNFRDLFSFDKKRNSTFSEWCNASGIRGDIKYSSGALNYIMKRFISSYEEYQALEPENGVNLEQLREVEEFVFNNAFEG